MNAELSLNGHISIMPDTRLSAEDYLCLLLSRGQLSYDQECRARQLLSGTIRWPELLDRVYAHETWPLVYRNLRELGFFCAPDGVRDELKRAYLATALKNQLASAELARLSRELSHAGIKVVPLKGVCLAETLYGDPATRVCADIDLLVTPAKLGRSVEVIRAAGYSDVFDEGFFRKIDLRHGRHYSFKRRFNENFCHIELHWRVVQHSSRDSDAVNDLWAEAQSTRCFGSPAYRLSPEWQFLYLCIHAADHYWKGLKWLVDVHQICTNQPPEWRLVKEKAQRFGLARAVSQTLAICSLVLGTPVPEAFASVSVPEKLRRSVLMLCDGQYQPVFSHLLLLERPWDKMRCVANILLVPKPADRSFVHLPRAVSFLYYPLRAFRLLAKRVWCPNQLSPRRSELLRELSAVARNHAGT
jgi:Uncharacterised nucleotidyltransferase